MLYDAITRQAAHAYRVEMLRRDYLRACGQLPAQENANAGRVGDEAQRLGLATGEACLRGQGFSFERCPRRVTASAPAPERKRSAARLRSSRA